MTTCLLYSFLNASNRVNQTKKWDTNRITTDRIYLFVTFFLTSSYIDNFASSWLVRNDMKWVEWHTWKRSLFTAARKNNYLHYILLFPKHRGIKLRWGHVRWGQGHSVAAVYWRFKIRCKSSGSLALVYFLKSWLGPCYLFLVPVHRTFYEDNGGFSFTILIRLGEFHSPKLALFQLHNLDYLNRSHFSFFIVHLLAYFHNRF